MTESPRKVRFHSRVQFKTIRHVANFSDEEIIAGWYCKKDFMRMSDEVSEIAKLVASGQEVYNGEELCTRGLEHLVEEDVADYRAEKMIASIDAVLDEQDEQIDENVYDPYTIAEVYSEIVTPLLREAYLVGLRDAKEGAAAAALIPDIMELPIRSTSQVKDNFEQRSVESPVEIHNDVSVGNIVESTDREVVDDAVRDGEESPDGDHDGEENLNTSLNSIVVEVAPDRVRPTKTIVNEPTKKKKINLNKGIPKKKSTDDADKTKTSSPTSPTRTARRKAIDRKGGTELSPFVFRRDGTIGFRNYDMEHKKREQSRLRKDCIKSSLFSALDGEEEEDENFAAFLAEKNKEKPKESKLYSMKSRGFTTSKKR